MAAKTATGSKVAPLSDRVVIKALEETEQYLILRESDVLAVVS